VDHAGGGKAIHFAVTLSPNQGAANGVIERRACVAGRLCGDFVRQVAGSGAQKAGREARVVRGSTGRGERPE